MFTGLIDHSGTVTGSKGGRLTIQSKFTDITEGESIAVNGVCLTARDPRGGQFIVELSPETLAVTTFGSCEVGSRVNLERSLRVGDRLGGHFVTGHVDEIATVSSIESQGEFCLMRFTKESLEFVVHKGSIAINGVSLTVNSVDATSFSVMLIPHTLELTNLKELQEGSQVNIEYDMLAKFVKQMTIGAAHG